MIIYEISLIDEKETIKKIIGYVRDLIDAEVFKKNYQLQYPRDVLNFRITEILVQIKENENWRNF